MKITLGRVMALTGLLLPVLMESKEVKGEADPNQGYEAIQLIKTTELVYPQRLLMDSVDQGEVNIMVMINADGQLVDWLVTGYSHPLFAKEVLDALLKWKFNPAHMQGKAVASRTELRFVFKDCALIRVLSNDTGLVARQKILERNTEYWALICPRENLDAPLDAQVEISPMPPDQLGATAKEGRVIVDYLVDPEGKVRMPMIISADDEAFARSVLLAVNECRYVVPRREGVPVITRVRRQFVFSPVST